MAKDNDWGIWKIEVEVNGQKEAIWFSGEASSRDILGLALALLDRSGLCPTRCMAMKSDGPNERSVTFLAVKPFGPPWLRDYQTLLLSYFEVYAHPEVQVLLGQPRALVEAEYAAQTKQADEAWDMMLGEKGASERIRRELQRRKP